MPVEGEAPGGARGERPRCFLNSSERAVMSLRALSSSERVAERSEVLLEALVPALVADLNELVSASDSALFFLSSALLFFLSLNSFQAGSNEG